MTTLVAAVAWVPQGYAAEEPKKYILDDEEFERVSKLAQLNLEDARDLGPQENEAGGQNLEGKKAEDDEELKEYNLDNYDEEDEEDEAPGTELGIFSNIKGLTYYANNDEDPYITLKDDVDDEREDLKVLPSDNLIVAAKMEDDVSYLEVYIYEPAEDNLYVHHDIMLSNPPLCVEWLDFDCNTSSEDDGSGRGNMAAIGTFDPDIEIWDLDVVDAPLPALFLGAAATPKEKKKGKKRRTVNDEYHVDAIMSLSANRLQRNLLLSGSADTTIKLWDLKDGSRKSCVQSYRLHSDKVSGLHWHPKEAYIALTGSYDKGVYAADIRTKDGKGAKWTVSSDVEGVRWNPHDSNYFYEVSTDNGILHYYDVRTHSAKKQKPVWLLQAHDDGLSSFDISPTHPGIIVTGSTDKLVKLWHVAPTSKGPSVILSRDLDLGKIFSTQFAPDAGVATRVAVAGESGSIKIWDLSTSSVARKAFGISGKAKEAMEEGKVVGVPKNDEDDEDDEEEDGEEGAWENMDDN